MFFFVIFSSGCFASDVAPVDDVDIRDYKELFKRCNGKACCESSVKSVKKSKGFLLRKNQPFECPEGFQADALKCIDSYRFCAPKNK